MLHQIAKSFVPRAVLSGVRSGSHHSQVVPYELRPPTLDEYPVPQGSWQEDYNKKQKRFNIHLAAGVIIFSSTIAFLTTRDWIFFNAFPPKPKSE